MHWGEVLIRGTALVTAVCYLTRVLLDVVGGTSHRVSWWNRAVWSLGCGMLWVHIGFAFHYVHDWSHAAAIRQTAQQTGELMGWYWGGGVYINYALALFWLGDAIAWWRQGLDSPRKSPRRFWTTHAIFGFLMFNATVIFGPDYWKTLGLLFLGILFAAMIYHRSQR